LSTRMAERGQPALPSLTTETVPGGHFFADQFPEETARIVSEFLSGEAREDLPPS
jgi:surfactin synthase thioesterase subunit